VAHINYAHSGVISI